MARFEFRLPDLGEGVHEGEIVAWHAAVGDVVREHDPIVEVMTDKSTVAIGAPRDGRLLELRLPLGAVAHVGDVIFVLEVEGGVDRAAPPLAEPAVSVTPEPPHETVASAVGDIRESLPGTSYLARGRASTRPDDYFCEKPLATPATRRLARELEVDLRRVRPLRADLRVTDDDVREHHEHHGHPLPRATAAPGDRRIPFVGIRRKIANRMQHAVTTAAHFTFVEECDVGRLIELRASMRPRAAEHGVDLHFLPFVAKAVTEALLRHPALHCALDEEANEIVFRSEVHLGIATATDAGLVVPVVRDAHRRSILDLAREIDRVATGARDGRLRPSELSGSTFTITSLGKQGGLFATPVLNLPEVGILGIHQIKRKPVVRGDRIEIGDVMLLSLTCDHRLVDGHAGAAFAYDVIETLEHPERLLASGLGD